MSKKIKVKLVDKEKLTFELLEDAQKGDRFTLTDEDREWLQSIDSIIEQDIEKYISEKKKEDWKKEFLLNDEEVNKLREQIENLKTSQNKSRNQIANLENEQKIELDKKDFEIIRLTDKLNDLTNSLQEKEEELQKRFEVKQENLINTLETEKKVLKQEYESKENQKFLEQKEELTKQINKEKEEFFNKQLEQSKNDWKELKEQEKEKYEKDLTEKQEIIEDLKKQLDRRQHTNSKRIGEDFENWLQKTFYESFSNLDETVTYEKITKNDANNEKADALIKFNFFSNVKKENIQETITIEAKSESNSGSQKNSSFYKKLDRNREQQKSKYAILVTELEEKDEFSIKSVSEYKNMYVCRPQYFILLINVLFHFAKKESELTNVELNFKTKEEIQKEFENFKKDSIEKLVDKVDKQIPDMFKQVESIEKAVEKLREILNDKFVKYFNQFKSKLEELTIKKQLLKKIDSITEDDSY
ncbi:DUF2130 domain-containing protein [Mycoplasma sp. 1654_15]|uniref:DUF2130 domain-containing protein n=1 Tax=Mycoplasma sp. 1654_15 TaxID=2725994 RepID=UPI00144A0CE6|nr:DUF2130 domain-containing protein [Mycoplasma sp. 1654_15]QJB71064.1 DUF2130 domain-containing protein [Mycoplasma sp. 1654_15]